MVSEHLKSVSTAGRPDELAALPDPVPGLSEQLKRHTRDCHRRAERAGIIREIVRGTACRAAYALYLRNLQPVYACLERRLAPWRSDPALGALADPALCRSQALTHDLDRIAGRGWQRILPRTAAGEAYERRIAEAIGPQLVAHAYTRYLGDLNGGRVLQRLLAQSLALPPDCLTFFRFPASTDVDSLQSAVRRAIDGGVAAADIPAVLTEARRAFEFNIALAEDVLPPDSAASAGDQSD